MVADWDCNFVFSKDEILQWRNNDFYLFLLGQHMVQGSTNTFYREGWRDTHYYNAGKDKAFRKMKSKTVFGSFTRRANKNIKTPTSRSDLDVVKTKVFFEGVAHEVYMPKSTKRTFIPEVGMNFTVDASIHPYHFYIRQSKFIFIWKRVPNGKSFDFTPLLMYGKGEWPDELKHIYLLFDTARILRENIREYHFINFIIRKKQRSHATYLDWVEFQYIINNSGELY
jgi:hypothetical protein